MLSQDVAIKLAILGLATIWASANKLVHGGHTEKTPLKEAEKMERWWKGEGEAG